uniref:Uncharacterized protein n=1 Tax=Arundo donax TaxID=35708 RepID=A0A0A9BT60_ARUDO
MEVGTWESQGTGNILPKFPPLVSICSYNENNIMCQPPQNSLKAYKLSRSWSTNQCFMSRKDKEIAMTAFDARHGDRSAENPQIMLIYKYPICCRLPLISPLTFFTSIFKCIKYSFSETRTPIITY